MRRRSAVAEFEAALILIAMVLSMATVVYQAVRTYHPQKEVVFVNHVASIPGSPQLVLVVVNASASSRALSVEADSASSALGVLYFDGSTYGTSGFMCEPASTTFFSVYAPSPGTLQVDSNGRTWIDGRWTATYAVDEGWHEVMIAGGSSCTVTVPGGQSVSYPGPYLSSSPLEGSRDSTGFSLFVPTDGLKHTLMIAFDGGLDRVAS